MRRCTAALHFNLFKSKGLHNDAFILRDDFKNWNGAAETLRVLTGFVRDCLKYSR